MSSGRRSAKDSDKTDYDPESVPKNLQAHNKPGRKEFNAPGTVPGASSDAKSDKRPTGAVPKSFTDQLLSGAASLLASATRQEQDQSELQLNLSEDKPGDETEDVFEDTEDPTSATTSTDWRESNVSNILDDSVEEAEKQARKKSFKTLIIRPKSERGTPTAATPKTEEPSPPASPGTEFYNPYEPSQEEADRNKSHTMDQINDQMQQMMAKLTALENENIKLQQAQAMVVGGPVPTGPRREIATQESKIPAFEGLKDSRTAEMWFSKAESIATQNQWTDARFIEAATSVMTKEAEQWVAYLKNQQQLFKDRTLSDKTEFKTAFLRQFDQLKSISGQKQTLRTMSQGKDESVNAFWVRVGNYFNEMVKAEADKMNVDATANNGEGNEDFKKINFLAKFMRDKMIVPYFVGGLRADLEKEIAPRMKEIQERDPENGILQAAIEAERAAPVKPEGFKASIAALEAQGIAEEELAKLDPSTREALVAAFSSGSSRGRGAGRGGRGGRGGGNARGGASGGAAAGDSTKVLRNIQSRTKARFCHNCKQWAKHQASECRYSAKDIAALTPMDPATVPDKSAPLFDALYDNKDTMPVFPAASGNA